MWSSQSTASYLPKRKESTCPHKDLYTIAYSSFVCNSPCLKTTQYLLADEQVCHDGCIHTMDYYSVIKGSELFKKKKSLAFKTDNLFSGCRHLKHSHTWLWHIHFLNFLLYIGIELINNVVIVSGGLQKELSHTYTCIHSPPNSPLIQDAT